MNNPALTKQPRGLYILFFAELWERYAFYTVQALLVLFLIKKFDFTDPQAYALYGGFSSLIYLTPLMGGYLADRFLGFRTAIYIGSLFYFIGFASVVIFGGSAFYIMLACLVIANGFFKANISSLLGSLYQRNDIRRDSAYNIFYMGVNVGALMASLSSSYIAVQYGYYTAFGIAGCGMLISFLTCLTTFNQLGNHGLAPEASQKSLTFMGISLVQAIILVVMVASIFLITALLKMPVLLQYLCSGLVAAAFLFLLTLALRQDKTRRNKIFAIFLYCILSILFWSLYAQMFSSVTLFTQRNVARELFGWTIPAAMFTGLVPFLILLFSPLLALVWIKLSKKDIIIATPYKFALSLVFIGLAFFTLKLSTVLGNHGMVKPYWIVLSYFLWTLGELLISPIGLAMISILSPKHLMGRMMGFWFLCVALGYMVGGKLASLASIPTNTEDPMMTAGIYAHDFMLFTYVAIGGAILTFSLGPWLKKLSADNKIS